MAAARSGTAFGCAKSPEGEKSGQWQEGAAECELMHQATLRLEVLLRQAVAQAATASEDARMHPRRCAAKLRRRIVRITAIKELLSGRNPAKQGASGRWPTDRGT